MIHDVAYSDSLIDVEDYVVTTYEGIFDKLDPMKELSVTVNPGECNFIASNLYVVHLMSELLSDLEESYQNDIDLYETYLGSNETAYST